ncbi:MAG: methionine gamma-lyase family protein [Clostridiales bacterium]|nr:methionine gamma-lyase family protein [Clostridiales bacterium]
MHHIEELIAAAEASLQAAFAKIDARELALQARVLQAFQNNRVSARHFAPSNGYGYDDVGRDCLDKVFAEAMEAEDALVRPQIANGTHAIFLALSALLLPGDTAVSISGAPYDTLCTAIDSLCSRGTGFEELPLLPGASFDMPAIAAVLCNPKIKLIYIQRSRGYTNRSTLPIADMESCFCEIKKQRPDCAILVDNCYGEFAEAHEPTAVGADVIAGSLIKNPGGGIAPTGGYLAGRADLIEKIGYTLTVPGCGREIGSYEASYRPYYQGLFMAPHTVAQCQKTALLFASVLEKLGYRCAPTSKEERGDIIQSVAFGNKQDLIAFCRAIQAAAPVDGFVTPEPWAMPGYADPVIMAAGTFVQGATTELSCDAPLRPPFTAYLQGSLTYAHGKLAILRAAAAFIEQR